jgi:phosphonate transport system substrate-binding protein
MGAKKTLFERFFDVLLAIGFVLISIYLLDGCREDRPVIDLGGRVGQTNAALAEIGEPHEMLRVAVGAMLSPERTREYYKDLMEVIAQGVGRRAVFSQRRTYAEVNELVEQHEVDIAFVCSGPYTKGHEEFGMELLAVPVVQGKKVYHSYILVHCDSSARSLADLRGKCFAFTDPHSNTGCLVPTYLLAQMGETPESFFSSLFYSGSHDRSIKAVADGVADGAAVDSLIWEFLSAVDPVDTARTKIIAKSPPYGMPPVVIHPEFDDHLKQRLKTTLLSIHKSPQAIPLLHRLQIDRFEEGDDSMYDSVREMRHWLKQCDMEEDE